MALTITHQHQACTKTSSQTTNRLHNHHLILKVHPSSTRASANPNICHPRTATKVQGPMEFTQGCHDMEVDPVIATMNFHRMNQASNSSKCQAVRLLHQLPAISNQDRASGTFHLTTHIIRNSITTQRWDTLTTATITSKTS